MIILSAGGCSRLTERKCCPQDCNQNPASLWQVPLPTGQCCAVYRCFTDIYPKGWARSLSFNSMATPLLPRIWHGHQGNGRFKSKLHHAFRCANHFIQKLQHKVWNNTEWRNQTQLPPLHPADVQMMDCHYPHSSLLIPAPGILSTSAENVSGFTNTALKRYWDK